MSFSGNRPSIVVDLLIEIRNELKTMTGTNRIVREQSFYTRFVSGIGTTAEKLTDSSGETTIQNTGVTTLTIGSESSTLVTGQGVILGPASAAGKADGDEKEFETTGPMYILSSTAGGRCTLTKE